MHTQVPARLLKAMGDQVTPWKLCMDIYMPLLFRENQEMPEQISHTSIASSEILKCG